MTAVARDWAHDLVLGENVRFTEYFSTIGSKLAEGIKDGDIDPSLALWLLRMMTYLSLTSLL
jgi:D-serine dehydratase